MVYKVVSGWTSGRSYPVKTFWSTPPEPPNPPPPPTFRGASATLEPFVLLTTDRRLVARETGNFVSRESQSQ